MTFSFFLSIYSRCGAPASWAARHTTVCLDLSAAGGMHSQTLVSRGQTDFSRILGGEKGSGATPIAVYF